MAPRLTVTCPHCSAAGRVEVEIPEEGKLVVCPTCRYRFYVSPDGSTKRRQPPAQPPPPPRALNERHVDFVRQLDAEMPGWERDGIISAEQRQRILDRYTRFRPAAKSPVPNRLITILSILGALLVGAGIFSFVAANWSAFSRSGKLIVIIGAMLASHGTGYALRYGRRRYPRVGGALILLGGIIFGAAIYFVAQLFHISVHYPNGPLLWGLAIMPLAYLVSLPSLLFLAVADLLAWLAMEGSFHQGQSHDLALVVLVGTAGTLAWLMGALHQRRPHLTSLALPWQTVGAFATLGALFPFTFAESFLQQLTLGGLTPFYLVIGTLVVIVSGLLTFATPRVAGWWLEPATGSLLLAFFLLLASGLLPVSTAMAGLAAIAFNIAYALLIVGAIALGFQRQNMVQINIALLFFVIDLIARYVDVFWRLLPRSLFFIAGGLFLIAGGVFLERKRRIVLANLQDQEVSGVH
jgi:predicted Zn finger-like uncharacterized protein